MDMQTAAPSDCYRPTPANSPWTPEVVEALRGLCKEDLSAAEIVTRLPVQVSRNAVIGKINRLSLEWVGKDTRPGSNSHAARQARKAESARKQALRRRELREQARRVLPVPPQFAEEPLLRQPDELLIPLEARKTVMTLEKSSCRWPIGDPQHDDFHFCGRTHAEGVPYCDWHAQRAFQPIQPRRKEADLARRLDFRIREPA